MLNKWEYLLKIIKSTPGPEVDSGDGQSGKDSQLLYPMLSSMETVRMLSGKNHTNALNEQSIELKLTKVTSQAQLEQEI